jgi:phosphoglycerol transferase
MLKRITSLGSGLQKYFLVFAVAILFVTLLFRNSGIYPVVLGDEYIYSKLSRLLPFADATIPGYVYLAIYRATNICGYGFLDCARVLNGLFFIAATPFIYLTTRRVCTRGVSSIVALLALLGPINSYTAYYMPEAPYFFSFWLLTWFILRLDHSFSSKSWCFSGILLGLSALVKPHALFFLPALVTYILYVSRKEEGEWVTQAFKNAFFFTTFTFLTKLLIGYFFAGRAGVTIFGPMYTAYTSIESSTTSDFQRYLELLILSTEILKGHVLALCLMFGAPIGFAINASLSSVLSKAEIKVDQKISFYTLVVLVNLVLVTSLFTALVANSDPTQTVTRLHMRYYNFALPLLLVITASQLSLEPKTSMLRWRAITAFPIGVAILYAIYTRLAPYTPNFVDNPELRGFTFDPIVFYVLSGISSFVLVLWVYSAQASAKTFIYFFMPLAVAFSTFYVNQELRLRLVPDVFDKAGIFTKQYLSNEELSKLVIVGSEPGGLFRSLFYLADKSRIPNNPQASFETIPKGINYDSAKIPAGKEWILLIGDHSLPENTFFQLAMNGFTLARVTGTDTVDFKKSAWHGFISRTQGLSEPEAWGAWSLGDAVTLEFSKPLPEKFTVHLVAYAFGPNVGKEFVAHVGDRAIRFTLGASSEERVLKFNNPKRSRTITIDIPSPASPKELGLSSDERSVGIGFTKLSIAPL